MHHLVRAVILGAFTFAMGSRSVAQELPLTIQWPLDIQEDCSLTLEDIDPGMPMLIGPDDCTIDSSVFVDELLETECEQNVRIERTWTVYACDKRPSMFRPSNSSTRSHRSFIPRRLVKSGSTSVSLK